MSNRTISSTDSVMGGKELGPAAVYLEGLPIAVVRAADVVDMVFARLQCKNGGWLVTANVDFLQRATGDPAVKHLYESADLIVADGMPLLWAARLRRTPLPERIAGSDLVWQLAERAAREGRSLYLLGGSGDAGRRAGDVLLCRWPSLRIAGWSSPTISNPIRPQEFAEIRAELLRCRPDLVFVALGSPKQEHLIRALRTDFPQAWMVGCGFSLSFIAGDVARAPRWMQRAGMEWLHRLSKDPRRLFPRYILRDLPYTVGLLARAALSRLSSNDSRPNVSSGSKST